ncbi:MAG: bifunctional molybdenum cofactor biosynthesis protein MoaC/MoaB [Cytophagales bacterium]|nr:MAG: bifunctional molybdenum cofactor biosynthesis protein MoaC/MoaB [Cytophagales bacterium]
MVNITHKSSTLRKAIAMAVVKVGDISTINAVLENTVPKGNVMEMAKAAGFFAIKKTSEIIPDCHPLPIEYAHVSYQIEGLEIKIKVEVQTIYKTGVEVEAMHGASVVALTIYDMLKPIDKNITIEKISLLEKTGGKSDYKNQDLNSISASIIVYSDEVYNKIKDDNAGKATFEYLQSLGLKTIQYQILPNNKQELEAIIKAQLLNQTKLILIVGGTGVGTKDDAPEIVSSFLDKELPGVMESARGYGQARTPHAMLSRGVAGVSGGALLITLPGSTKGAKETMQSLFPSLFHVFKTLENNL